ncbi:MAG: ribonuclease H-like domain-containing protein [Candidatus Thermoplasmatota archaeon]
MLEHTFVHLPGVGRATESSFWKRGVTTWREFLSERRIPRVSDERKAAMDALLLEGVERLRDSDSRYFRARMADGHLWRLLRDFRGGTVYLDIETTGISVRSPVTVVGVHTGSRTHTLIRGRDLNGPNLEAILSSASLLVTFNGRGFDIPVLRAQFPGRVPDTPHVDLRHLLARLGHRGGLKAIERELGVERDRRVELMTGADAVYLWRLWERRGKANALDLLVEYNTADCENLRGLAEYAYDRMRRQTFSAVARGKP